MMIIEKDEVRIIETAKGWSVQFKQRLPKGKKPRSIFVEESVWINEGTTSVGNQELLKFFGVNLFDNAKPSNLLKKIIGFNLKENDIVLDFFSGSGTLAQAIMEYNFQQNISSKYILVQLQEDIRKKINETSGDAKKMLENAINFLQSIDKNAYITEIAKERIRRAGDKIVSENKDKKGIEDLDIGFKVFKLDSSNIKPWNPRFEDIAHKLDEMVDNFVPGRTEEDVVYEIMLKYGIDLTYPIEVREISGKKVFSIGFGALIICLDNEITLELVNGIVDLKNELDSEPTRVVFKDNGFKTDSVKTNAIEILKRNNINENEVMSI